MDRWIISIQLPHLTQRLTVMDARLFHAAGQSRSRPPGLCVRDSSVTRVAAGRASVLASSSWQSLPFFFGQRGTISMRYFVSERLALLPFAEVKGPRGKSVYCEGAQLGKLKAVERDTFFRRVALKVSRFKNHRRDLSQESSNARVRPSP